MAINDFGEKIGGAKKDLWKARGLQVSDLLEMNAAERLKLVSKDNVWAKPDFAALVAEGMPKRVAWFVKTVRDSLPAKPILGYGDDNPEAIDRKQRAYIDFLGDVRDAVMACRTDEDILKIANRQWLADKGFIEAGRSYYVNPTPLGDSAISNKFLRAFCLTAYDVRQFDRDMAKKQFLFTDDEKTLSKYEFYRYANVEWNPDYDGKTQMGVPVPGGIRYFYPEGELADEDTWEEGTFFVAPKDNGRRIVGRNFETREEAKQFVLDLEAGKEPAAKPSAKKGRTRFTPKQLAHIERKMPEDYRHGKNVGGAEYMEVFGFRGGEFGNWMSEQDRLVSMNMGYEALLDLAKALQIEPEDISLGGALAIAFGARGRAGAAAHYEPDREVINLTKMNGAGSLAHEWGHAMDDILGKQLGLKGFMSENLRGKAENIIPESFQKLIDALQYKMVAPEEANVAREKDILDYISKLKRYIDVNFFPIKSMTEEQIAKKDALVEAYYVNAAHVDKAASLEVVMSGNGNKDVDALSALRKEITGRGIPKQDRIQLGHWQNSLNSKIKMLNAPSRVETDFYRDSKIFDTVHSKTNNGYWQSKVEMFARAFACYVSDKLEGRSDYICGHSEAAVSLAMIQGEMTVIKAIPQGEERTHINQCFDEMFAELKEKGLLHHREDFTAFVERHAPPKIFVDDDAREMRMAEIEAFDPERTEQLSFEELLGDAFSRSDAATGARGLGPGARDGMSK